MRGTRKLAIVGAGLAIAISASATSADAITGPPRPGTVTCASVTGKIKFSPPLVAAGTSQETALMYLNLKQCTVAGGATVTPKIGVIHSSTVSVTTSQNICTFGNAGPATPVDPPELQLKWVPPSKIAPSSPSFSFTQMVTSPSGDVAFDMSRGTVTGSYPQSVSGSWTIVTNTSASGFCTKPVKKLTIVSGSATV